MDFIIKNNKVNNNNNFIGITKFNRILNYLKNLEENIEIEDGPELKKVEDIKDLIIDRIKRLKNIYLTTYFLYFGLYFSFVSILFSDVFLISKLNIVLGKVFGLVGTSTFVILIYFVNNIKDLYYQDLNLLAMQLISIYDNNLKNNSKNIFNLNNYNAFIDFFKKRGF